MMTTIAPMTYRIEYIGTSFLSLYNDRSGPRYGAPRSLRYRWMPGSGRRTAGGLTSLDSYLMGPGSVFHPGVSLS
jgi:hypothetical protein